MNNKRAPILRLNICSDDQYSGFTVRIVVGHGAGLHVVLMLPDTLFSEAEIIDRARQKGIMLFPFSEFHVAGQPEATTLLLGFGGMNSSDIEQGIAILSQIC